MENDDAPVGTILCRRQVLRAAAQAGAGFLALNWLAPLIAAEPAPSTQPKVDLFASPALTEGPFFVDEKLNRSNIVGDTKRASVVNGLPLALGFTIYQMAGKVLAPMKDVQVDVWHSDAAGAYSDESNPMNHEDTSKQTWLRGFQKTADDGKVAFETIVPGWYQGRTAHIHFKVRLYSAAGAKTYEFTSQLFVDDAITTAVYANAPYSSRPSRNTTNANDSVYNTTGTNGAVAGSQLLLGLTPASSNNGYVGTFSIGLQIA